MKSRTAMLCLVAFFALALGGASALWGDPPDRVGRLNFVSGPVSFHAQDVEEWSPATLNYPLTVGDSLWTDQNGQAELHVGSTAVRLASNTAISFLSLDDTTIQIRLSTGSLNLRVRRLGANEKLDVDTPSASFAIVRAGTYRIDVTENADTSATVRSGEIEVTAGSQAFSVFQKQSVSITGSDSPAYEIASAPPADAWDRWCQARDQKEDHIVSTRYVSSEINGVEDLDLYGSWSVDVVLGPVWTPRVTVVAWAPYRFGHWAWVGPWGWTWIDDAPWGFAPFHYGRWAYRGSVWVWVPGTHVRRPVYAPALVTFVGGPGWRPGQAPGESVGWFPLGPNEPYVPSYRSNATRLRNVSVAHITYVNRSVPGAVTVVPNEVFVRGQPAGAAALRLPASQLTDAPVRGAAAPFVPQRAAARQSAPEQPVSFGVQQQAPVPQVQEKERKPLSPAVRQPAAPASGRVVTQPSVRKPVTPPPADRARPAAQPSVRRSAAPAARPAVTAPSPRKDEKLRKPPEN